MNPSGANVATSKVDVVMKYVRANFPDKEVDHLPRSDGYADLFRVIDNREPRYQVLVTRKWFDAWGGADALENGLKRGNVAEQMRRSQTGGVVILDRWPR
jgi:hypothetical protein